MTNYRLMYRLGVRPWERYAEVTRDQTRALLERETSTRPSPPGRALDVGCGRGRYTPLLAHLGWQVVGLDYVPAAVDAGRAGAASGVTYVVGDVTDLSPDLGRFDFFLDVGCFQGLDAQQRTAYALGVTALAAPGAGMMQLSFGAGRWRSLVGGVSRSEVVAALPAWELVSIDGAATDGLGWPMSTTRPVWYWFRLRPAGSSTPA